MDIQLIKEHSSNCYIGVLAANSGYVLTKDRVDFGINYLLKRVHARPKPGGDFRYTWDGKCIDVQLKATADALIEDGPDWIKYDLEVKGYSDKVERATNSCVLPLMLCSFLYLTAGRLGSRLMIRN